jgi:UDP-N-acetylglucosamine--N-acetylmuramyl-(pentapeptide) pyrophosphoryl-undecaprenol N-acetylglucosamine transferase
VYIGCFGSGLGHATRMLEIAERLIKDGNAVRFSSSGEVADFISARGYECNRLPLADVKYFENKGVSLKASMVGSPQLLASTYRQLYLELGNMKRFGADVVLSDSSASTVFAARSLKIQVYTIINQLNLAAPESSRKVGATILSGGITATLSKIWELSDAILVPDLPPPYTISESSLWGRVGKNVRYVGFLHGSEPLEDDATSGAFASDPRPKIFWQVSGPPQTRSFMVKAGEAASRALGGGYVFVITEGNPAGARSPASYKWGWKFGWCDAPQAYLEACDVFVSRAGHGSIAKAIAASKPSLLVPIPNQTEQAGNAAKAVRLGVAMSIQQNRLNMESLRDAFEALRREPFLSRARSMGRVAARFDATETIVGLAEGRDAGPPSHR